jgi:hypothetical protein
LTLLSLKELAVAERHVDPGIRIARPGFEEQHGRAAIRGEAVREHAAGGPGADDDVVEGIQADACGIV